MDTIIAIYGALAVGTIIGFTLASMFHIGARHDPPDVYSVLKSFENKRGES